MAPSQVRNWEHSGSDCCSPISSCFLGWCCPCFLYGKVYHRTRKDSSMKDFSWCNGSCCGYYVIAMCGCHWILQMMQRGEMRSKYQLQGGGCKDCLCACCCTPCDLVQQDKEAEFRENEKRSLITQQPAGAREAKDTGMVYPPQQHQHQQPQYASQPPQYAPQPQHYSPQPQQYAPQQQHPQMMYPEQSLPAYPQNAQQYPQHTGKN